MPEKLTIDHEVELTRLQVQLSKDYLDSDASKKLLNEIDINGIGRSQTHIFAMLSELRSICNHPVLVTEDWSMAHVKAEDSAKLASLEELLDEVVAGEHRALFFCRSTRMHQILERFLNDAGSSFCNRQATPRPTGVSSWSIGSTHRQTSPSPSSAWDFPGR